MQVPVITIRHAENNHVFGFQDFSLFYVRGFDQDRPAPSCLQGDKDPRFGKTMAVGQYVAMAECPTYLHAVPYRVGLEGVGFVPAEGMNFMVQLPGGYAVLVEHARQIQREKVDPGFGGLPDTVTQTPGWQFGRTVFGFTGLEF